MPRTSIAPRLLAEILAVVFAVAAVTCVAVFEFGAGLDEPQKVLFGGAAFLLLCAPLVYWRVRRRAGRSVAAPGRARTPTRAGVLAASLGTLAVGCCLTWLSVAAARGRHMLEARAQFDRLADRLATETERRMNQSAAGLEGARGVYAASHSVERLEFRAYVRSLDFARELQGVNGFGFIERVRRDWLDDFLERERADDAPDFAVETSGDAPELYVLKFIDPIERNRGSWGYDLGSEPLRRAAIELAVRSGEPTLTPRIELFEGGRRRPGFLFLLPVYANRTHPETPAEREASLAGLVCAPLDLDEMLAGTTDAAEGKVDLEVFEGTQPVAEQLLYDWDGQLAALARPGAGRERLFHEQHMLRVGGRTWTLWLSTTPEFEASIRNTAPKLIGLTGVLLSALVGYLVWSLGSGRARALELAREMTADLAAAKLASESALREYEAMRGTLDEHSIVSVADTRGRIIDVNKAFCRISSYSRAELLGENHRLLNSGYHPRSFWAEGWASISSGKPWRAEICNRAKNGSLYWVDAVIAPFANADGRIERYFSISTDITARKQAEAEQSAALALATALARSSDARQAARAVNDALGETTGLARTAVLLYAEDGVCRFVGWRGLSKEYRAAAEGHCPWKQGQPDAALLVVEDARNDLALARFHDHFRREGIASLAFVPILTAKGVIGNLVLYGSKSGTMTPGRVHAALSAAAALGSAVARLRMAEALSTNERRFRSLVEGTDVIVWEFDTRREGFSYVSPQAARLGYPLEAWLVPGFWPAHLHPSDRDFAMAYCMEEAQAGRNHRFEYRWLAADGSVVWMENFVSVEKSADGQLLLRGVMIDITASKQVARDLMEARARAEAATRAKSEFLANMSHEIRTPLTAILGYSDLLREDGDLLQARERRLQALDTICGAGQYLLTVINDVLDLSKIEAGKMTVERVETPLVRILLEVAELVGPRAAEKGVRLRARLDTPLPERVLCDPTRLRQILMNLVGNAAKFTEHGQVTLSARAESREGQAYVVIDVDDTGPGLEPEVASRLFVAFSQADASVTRKHGGSGLGLTICRRLAELMGGTVLLVRTAPGQGSCFRVELPFEAVPGTALIRSLDALPRAAQPRSALPTARLSGRVLLAEDGRDNQRLISLHLTRAGLDVELADNGRVALARIEEAEAAGRPFDLLLSDMQMPVLDGYSLARSLRERGSTIPIVALTAHAMAEDRQRCLDAGCDDYATKPIDRAALLEACARWIGRPSAVRREPG